MRTEYILTAGAVVVVGVLLWNKDKITLLKGLPSISADYLSPTTFPTYPSPTEDAGINGYEGVPVSESPMPLSTEYTSACTVATYMDWLNWLAINRSFPAGSDDESVWETLLTGVKTKQGCFGNSGGGQGGSAGGLSDGQPNQYTPATSYS